MIRVIAPAIVILATSIAAVAAPKHAAKKHILVVTWTTGFRHQDTIGPNPTQDGPAQKILKDLGDSSGAFDVDYCRSQDDVKSMLTADGLKKYDGVFFANTTGNLGIPDLKGFCNWVKAGHAFMGTHSAGDTYHPRDAAGDTSYVDMVGCEFRTHGAQAEVVCNVEDPKHPAVKHWPSSFTIKDEIYHFIVNNRSTVHVLLALKTQGMDGVRDPKTNEDMSGKPTDMLISWVKNYGKGKVFYTALGHRPDVWARPDYQQHLLGGIKWALGLERGSAKTPSDTK